MLKTTSKATATGPEGAAAILPVADPVGQRFARTIVQLHRALRFRKLPDAVAGPPLCRLDGFGDGLTTLCVREGQLPERYLRGLMGFRLAQFLLMGWMDPMLAYRRGLFCEPIDHSPGPETIHTVTLTETGRIAGYLALLGAADPESLPLDSPHRARFPAEVAHHIDLVTGFAVAHRETHQVYELKRFVRDLTMEPGPQYDRVPWHLILCLGRAVCAAGANIQVLLGDARENGALRHLRMIGFTPLVVEGTAPSLPRTELMWPSYEQPKLAKPFIAEVPADLGEYLDIIEAGLTLPPGEDWQVTALAPLLQKNRRRIRTSERSDR